MKSNLTHILFLIATLASSAAFSQDGPQVSANSLNLEWAETDARSINIHEGNGRYITSIPGTASSWQATEPGDYFIVLTSQSDWSEWKRSNTVVVGNAANTETNSASGSFSNVSVSRHVINWDVSGAISINVHAADGSYVTTLAGDATSYATEEPGSYYLVATNTGSWESWTRSQPILVSGNQPAATAQPFSNIATNEYQANWSRIAANTINVHRGSGEYVTSLSGRETQWTAPIGGHYYFVATTDMPWQEWTRSELVWLTSQQNIDASNSQNIGILNMGNMTAVRDGVAKLIAEQNVVKLLESTSLGKDIMQFGLSEQTNGVTLTSTTPIPTASAADSKSETQYSCDLGGSIDKTSSRIFRTTSNSSNFNNCTVGNWKLSGSVSHSHFSSSLDRSRRTEFSNFKIHDAVTGKLLQAWNGTANWGGRSFPERSIEWDLSSAEFSSSDGTVKLSNATRDVRIDNLITHFADFNTSEAAYTLGYDEEQQSNVAITTSFVQADQSLLESFTVNADWSDNNDLSVDIVLSTSLKKIHSEGRLFQELELPVVATLSDLCRISAAAECQTSESNLNNYLLTDDDSAVSAWQNVAIVVTAADGSSLRWNRTPEDVKPNEIFADLRTQDGRRITTNGFSSPFLVDEFTAPYQFWWESDSYGIWAVEQPFTSILRIPIK